MGGIGLPAERADSGVRRDIGIALGIFSVKTEASRQAAWPDPNIGWVTATGRLTIVNPGGTLGVRAGAEVRRELEA